MYRISTERPRRKCITVTYTIFNRESVNIDDFRCNGRIWTEVIVRRTDRQTEVINIFQLSLESVWRLTCTE